MKQIATMVVLALLLSTVSLAQAQRIREVREQKEVGYIKVEAKGKLKTGIMAIGGETTGILLSTGKSSVELDFRKNPKLRATAEKLNGKSVVVTGELKLRRGVEIRGVRVIVDVSSIKEAK